MAQRSQGPLEHVGSWVVMEARAEGSMRPVWMWGLVRGGPGFEDVFFTEPDGVTPADIEAPPHALRTLFVAPLWADTPWGPPPESAEDPR
jgi:hypothetical protein